VKGLTETDDKQETPRQGLAKELRGDNRVRGRPEGKEEGTCMISAPTTSGGNGQQYGVPVRLSF
jgi:hypothetical protein